MLTDINPKLPMRNKNVTREFYINKLGFKEYGNADYDGYLRTNPDILKRYFSHPSLAPTISPDSFYFKEEKEADSFRIVVQGGSTAAGFPYGQTGSIAGMLHQRFKRLYPDKKIE